MIKAICSGTQILDQVMITDLLMENGAAVEAAGFYLRTGDFYCIRMKSTIVATGCFMLKVTIYSGILSVWGG
ncbi:MAG: hypothetical protein M1543_00130, partial [Firmicutes bacterium]|nr:hypothetical protein [Bacillota bacterium]